MSHNNDYQDYLNALEKRISVSEQEPAEVKKACSPKKRRGRYKVVRLRPVYLLCFLAASVILTVTVSVAAKPKAEPKPQNNIVSGEKYAPAPVKETEEPPLAFAFAENTAEIPASNDAAGAVVINYDKSEVIAARNPHERYYPASTTKVMTLLVAVENIKRYSDTFKFSYEIIDPLYLQQATLAGFESGEEVNMTDLLYGTILPSGADAAVGLAISVSGTEAAFVELMNKKVEELGLENTHFANVTGLHDTNNYTSPYDMAVILGTAMKNPICKKVLSTYQYTASPTEQHPEGLKMEATLFKNMYGTEPGTATIMGGKTGFINESGYCIASYGHNNTTKTDYIVVTMKNSTRWPAFHGQIDLYKEFAK